LYDCLIKQLLFLAQLSFSDLRVFGVRQLSLSVHLNVVDFSHFSFSRTTACKVIRLARNFPVVVFKIQCMLFLFRVIRYATWLIWGFLIEKCKASVHPKFFTFQPTISSEQTHVKSPHSPKNVSLEVLQKCCIFLQR